MALNADSAMNFFGSYSLLMILLESLKLLPKNGKLMVLIAIFSVFLPSCFSFLFSYSLQSVMADMLVTLQQSFLPDPSTYNMPDPDPFNSAEPGSFTPATGFNMAQLIDPLKADFAILLAIEITFSLAFSVIYFFSTISTVLVSALSYNGKNSSLQELFSTLWKTWTRPLITCFYVSCLWIGYFVFLVGLAVPLLMSPNLSTFWVAIFVGIPAFILYLYLLVPLTLSIVVSVVEESCYGLEALGKGAALVKGKRLHGFLLNLFYGLVGMIIFQGYKMILGKTRFPTISLMLLTSVLSLVRMLQMVAYTVFYFQCKEHHGEEIELNWSVHYTKLPITASANDMP